MLRPLLFTIALAAFCTVAVAQETPAAPPPPVDSMDCDQMLAELTVAGQRMNAQMDPEFANEAQAMHDEAQQSQNSALAQGVGASIACSIPGVGMACMAAQQAQAARAQQLQQQHMERMDAQMDRLNASMEGIDQQRMMALSQRYEQLGCQTPQQ